MRPLLPALLAVAASAFLGCTEQPASGVTSVPEIQNANHPQLCYLFFSPDVLENGKVFQLIDTIADKTPYTFVFLTPRPTGDHINPPCDIEFHDVARFHPILEKVVAHAHKRGLKIGLQLWPDRRDVAVENAERVVVEHETTLDADGVATLTGAARNVRVSNLIMQSGLLRAYAFKKTRDGFYEPGSVRDITDKCVATPKGKDKVEVVVRAGAACQGLHLYLLTEHYYSQVANSTPEAAQRFIRSFEGYRDIPFDGVALDEYGNALLSYKAELQENGGIRERFYHPLMSPRYEALAGTPLERGLLDMRYAPEGDDTVRMKAINAYMWTMRKLPLAAEHALYETGKHIYGKDTFIGIHNTFHNGFNIDEIWSTGINWWSVPRDYGQSDEMLTLPSRMGIAVAHAKNAEYNQYYDKKAERISRKALDDLRYGVRTHFHALNDRHGWGVSLEKPEVYSLMNPVERCARLLNRFNPELPEMRTLVVFGMEALENWYPDAAARNRFDIRGNLGIEEKAVALLKAGHLTPLVPSDLIVEGALKLGADGKPELQGRKFDSVVFLYPEYAHEPVLKFLEDYVAKGGKLMIEGAATHDFQGRDIRARFEALRAKATVTRFDTNRMGELGAAPNVVPGGCRTADGAFVFTDYESLDKRNPAKTQTVSTGGSTYAFDYRGLAAILADANGPVKFSARGVTSLSRDDKTLLKFAKPATVEIVRTGKNFSILVEGDAKPVVNNLASE